MIKAAVVGVMLLASAFLGVEENDIVKVGQPAPDFSGVTSDGQRLEASAFKGKVVLLNFFATWCPPCQEELPHLEKDVWQKYQGQGLVVVAIGREHTPDVLKKFKATKGLTFTVVADPKREIYARYAAQYIPRNYLIGKDGVIKYTSAGWEPEEMEKMTRVIEAELKR